MRFDARLYLVTGEVRADTTLESVVGAALAGGVTALQLRDKTPDLVCLERQTHALAVVAQAHGVPLLINDAIEVAGLADGAHVGVDDMRPEDARRALGPASVIGWSINDLDQLDDERAMAAIDYVAVSPVWATTSKADATRPLGLQGVRAVRRRIPAELPLVAIGGINAANAEEAIAAGADGVAVMSALCLAEDPSAAAMELLKIVDEALARRGEIR